MFVGDINLSQSQKQRISLARCIIHDPDLLLIEDCFG
jgi:ABC-type multidrug transport system fused ATPase/permease subunit